jgi:hypothetical protein
MSSNTDNKEGFIEYAANQPLRLSNINCAYCARLFNDDVKKTKEHVVGRNFVPKGAFDDQWNLIVNACVECNNFKATLENDLSAITMQPDSSGRHVNNDTLLAAEALRKGKGAISHKTGKPVKDSKGAMDITLSGDNFNLKFGMIAPPQIDFPRVSILAQYFVRGFFFMQTYNNETRTGGYPLGEFHPLIHADKSDWGNDVMKWFMQETQAWETRLFAITANNYFKIKFRKSSEGLLAWSIEMNQNTRCIGFWGEKECIADVLQKVPTLQRKHVSGDEVNGLFVRTEKLLSESEDVLFSTPAEQ